MFTTFSFMYFMGKVLFKGIEFYSVLRQRKSWVRFYVARSLNSAYLINSIRILISKRSSLPL